MSDIDREKLEAALEAVALAEGYMSSHQAILVAAARAHLATLPRFKEVEREAWEVLDHDGVCHGIFGTEEGAHRMSLHADDRFIIRLTGIAKVRA